MSSETKLFVERRVATNHQQQPTLRYMASAELVRLELPLSPKLLYPFPVLLELTLQHCQFCTRNTKLSVLTTYHIREKTSRSTHGQNRKLIGLGHLNQQEPLNLPHHTLQNEYWPVIKLKMQNRKLLTNQNIFPEQEQIISSWKSYWNAKQWTDYFIMGQWTIQLSCT